MKQADLPDKQQDCLPEVVSLSADEAVCIACGGGVTWAINARGLDLHFCRTHLLALATRMKRAVSERDRWLKKYYAGKIPAYARDDGHLQEPTAR